MKFSLFRKLAHFAIKLAKIKLDFQLCLGAMPWRFAFSFDKMLLVLAFAFAFGAMPLALA